MRRLLLLLLAAVLALASASQANRRHVLLQQGRVLDTTIEAKVSKDLGHRRHAAKFEDDAQHQYIVHFRGPVTSEMKRAAARYAGVHLGQYLPHNSFIFAATREQAEKMETAPNVLWVGAFRPEYKMPQELHDWENRRLPGTKKTELFVILHSSLLPDQLRAATTRWQRSILVELKTHVQIKVIRGNKLRVRVPSIHKMTKVAEWLAEQPLVHWIEPVFDYEVHANSGGTGLVESNSTDHSFVLNNAGLTGGAGNGLSAEVIVVGDSGIDYQSCFFDGPSASAPPDGTSPPDPNRKVVKYVTTYADGVDFTGHGTAVSGAAAGNTSDATNSAYNGLAPGAKLYVVDLGLGNGIKPPPDVVAYLETPFVEGATVSVNAFGSPAQPTWYTSTAQEVDDLISRFPNYVVIFSAGNYGNNGTGTISDPAIAKNVLTVGASQNDCASLSQVADPTLQARLAADPGLFGTDTLAFWSSRGPTPDGRIKPDVVAPSWYVTAASPNTLSSCVVNASYGASIGAGFMGAAAALVRQYFLGGWSATGAPDPNEVVQPSAALIKAVLINSGVSVLGMTLSSGRYLSYSGQLPHDSYGFGRPVLENTLFISGVAGGAAWGTLSSFQDNALGVGTGQTVRTCVAVTDASKPFKATLVWTDQAGAPAAGIALINNLDLIVMDPDGVMYRGNQAYLNPAGFDSVNNVEEVTVSSPKLGSWVVYVHGFDVPHGTVKSSSQQSVDVQPYALVISGIFTTGAQCPPYCPNGCTAPYGTCNGQGASCTCINGTRGVDCSVVACPNNCTSLDGYQNGYCDVETGTCICSSEWMGADCRLPFELQLPDVVQVYAGLPAWQVIVIAVFAFTVGGLMCCLLGWFLGLRRIGDSRGDHTPL